MVNPFFTALAILSDSPIFTVLAIVLVVLLLVLITTLGYVKAPPDQAFIISGLRRRIVIGKATVRIPFFERLDKLSLKMISIDVKTDSFVPNAEYIDVKVDAAVKVRVSSDSELLNIAARNFLNKNDDYIISQVVDALQGNMREIIGQMRLSEMVTDRKLFGEKVRENAVPDLANMGLEIISFNVQNFEDKNGVIADLGIDNVSQIKKNASIAKAEAEKEIAIAQARAAQEANDAKVESDKEIAQKQNDLLIKKAELKQISDIKQAESDVAYRIEEERQRKQIEIETAEANIAKQEKEIVRMEKEALVNEKSLEATVRKKADADRYEREQQAQALLYEQQKAAEAELFEKQKKYEAMKLEAEATLEMRKKEAAGIAALGAAEAEAIRAKALAEAEGIDKKAEAMKKYGEAAIAEMYFNALPKVAKEVAAPLASVDKITMYGEGNSAKLIQDIVNSSSQVQNGLAQGLGIDLSSVLGGFLGGKIATKAPQETTESTKKETPNSKPKAEQ